MGYCGKRKNEQYLLCVALLATVLVNAIVFVIIANSKREDAKRVVKETKNKVTSNWHMLKFIKRGYEQLRVQNGWYKKMASGQIPKKLMNRRPKGLFDGRGRTNYKIWSVLDIVADGIKEKPEPCEPLMKYGFQV